MNTETSFAKPFREESFSFFTHLGGAILAVFGSVLLILRASGPLALAAVSIYGVTLIAMFASSALHHVACRDDGALRKIDMTAIYLLIAGTYTPFCLLALPPAWGWSLFAVVWALAGGGIALRWTLPKTPRWITVGLYLGLGWMAVVALVPFAQSVAWKGVFLLATGGIIYSVGAVVYARKRPDPWPRIVGYHGVWHVFVLLGALSHFALVWLVSTG